MRIDILLSGDYTAHVAAWADARLPEARNCGDSAGFQESRASDDTKPQVSQDPIATFLLKTLVPRRSLRSRKTAHYVALRSWKQSVKDTQIAALRSLKAQLQPTAVALIAEEIATAARELYGGMIFTCVVPVPCGSSGHPRCLSVLLAEHVAMLLGVPFRQVLTGAMSRGASHPRKNSALPQFQVHGEISGQVLVIDDVASTGTHIELAVRALRAKGASPLAIAWIGS